MNGRRYLRSMTFTLVSSFRFQVLHACTSYGEADGFFMVVAELVCGLDYTGEVAATTGTGHLPGQDLVLILIYVRLHGALNHGREHGGLGVEGGSVGIGKGCEVFGHDGQPAVVCGLG